MITLGDMQKRWLRIGGHVFLGLVTFLIGLHLTFPNSRLKDRLVEALSDEYDVSISEVQVGWLPGHVTLKGVTLAQRQAGESEEKPTGLQVDRLDVNVGLLALITGKTDVGINAQLGQGEVVGHVARSSSGVEVTLRTKGLPLESIPNITTFTGGAPITGGVDASIELNLPKGKWKDAEGSFDLSSTAVSIGDGKTKVKPMAPGQVNAFNAEGFTLPRLRLGKLSGRIRISKGVACFENLSAKSQDLDGAIEGGIHFADPVKASQTQYYARFKFSDTFKATADNASFETLVTSGARGEDGYSAYQARGPVTQLRWLVAKAPPPPMRECSSGTAPPAPGPKELAGPRKPGSHEPPQRALRPGMGAPPIPGPTPQPGAVGPTDGLAAPGIPPVGVGGRRPSLEGVRPEPLQAPQEPSAAEGVQPHQVPDDVERPQAMPQPTEEPPAPPPAEPEQPAPDVEQPPPNLQQPTE